jgi:phosphoglycolate phosphatase-like HAD superfamily hydrolase
VPFRPETYDFFVFDCDGVILDSNEIKSQAFFDVTLRFGPETADRFVAYHKRNGGVSRQEKFKYFVAEILEADPSDRKSIANELIEAYGQLCRDGLETCPMIEGVQPFLASLPKQVRNFVVSGGAQTEVRHALKTRHLDQFFSLILGNPKSKAENMQHLFDSGSFDGRGANFGDARLDMELAEQFGLDCVFVSGTSEWKEAEVEFCGQRVYDFRDLLESTP